MYDLQVYFLTEDAKHAYIRLFVCYVGKAAFKNQGLLKIDLKVIAVLFTLAGNHSKGYKYY